MLVLTRKPEEKIFIGKKDKIIITVLRIQGDKVSIGIEADKTLYPVFREELISETPEDEMRETCEVTLDLTSI